MSIISNNAIHVVASENVNFNKVVAQFCTVMYKFIFSYSVITVLAR